jgi:hypothetical protein
MSIPDRPRAGVVAPYEAKAQGLASVPAANAAGPALFVKWRYEAAKTKAVAYTGFLRALEDGVDAAAALERAIAQRELGTVELERIEDLKQVEHRRIDSLVMDADAAIAEKRVINRTRLATLEYEARLAEQRLKSLDQQAAEPEAPAEDPRTPAERARDSIKRLRAEHALIAAELREAAGAQFSEADEQTIAQMELVIHDRINRIIEHLRDEDG